MFTKIVLATLVASLALSSTSHAATGNQGRQVYDPPSWSFACMTDHGPRVWCDEPVRTYGN